MYKKLDFITEALAAIEEGPTEKSATRSEVKRSLEYQLVGL